MKAARLEHPSRHRVHFSSASAEWMTPDWFLDHVYAVLGKPVGLDPCAEWEPPEVTVSNRTVTAFHYFSQEEDGLAQPWDVMGPDTRFYINPPYGKARPLLAVPAADRAMELVYALARDRLYTDEQRHEMRLDLAEHLLGEVANPVRLRKEAAAREVALYGGEFDTDAVQGLIQWATKTTEPGIDAWVAKMVGEFEAGRVREGIALLPNRTDNRWYQTLREFPRCHIEGRLKFSGNEDSAPFPSMAVYLGSNVVRFREVFACLGGVYFCLTPPPRAACPRQGTCRPGTKARAAVG